MSKAMSRVIQQNRKEILAGWHGKALALFSEKMARGTPIFDLLHEAMGMILDGFEEGGESCTEGLSSFSRIFAIHPFPPSRSMRLFFELQTILMAFVSDDESRDLLQTRIKEIMLEACDDFMAHREKIYQLKVEERQRSMFMALRRAEG
jgi:hypothetical protein